jgi:hypothetical protein
MSDEMMIYIQLAEINSGHNFTKMIFSFMMFLLNHLSFIMFLQGWIQHDLVRGVLCQLWCRVVSVMRAARPSTCFTTVKSCLTTEFEL